MVEAALACKAATDVPVDACDNRKTGAMDRQTDEVVGLR